MLPGISYPVILGQTFEPAEVVANALNHWLADKDFVVVTTDTNGGHPRVTYGYVSSRSARSARVSQALGSEQLRIQVDDTVIELSLEALSFKGNHYSAIEIKGDVLTIKRPYFYYDDHSSLDWEITVVAVHSAP